MKRRLLISLAVLAGVGVTTTQHADAQEAGYAVSVFEPSERGSDWFANESNDYRGKLRLAVGAVGDYSYRGLVGAYNPDGSVHASVLRNQMLVHTGASLVIAERLRLGLSVPIQLYADGHPTTYQGVTYNPSKQDQSIGDIRASMDLRIAGEYGDPITLAIGGSLFIPVGQREQFTGDDVTRFAPHVNIAGDSGAFAYALRAGYELRPLRVNYIDTRTGSNITFGGAAGLRFANKQILVGPEVYGRTGVSNADGPAAHDTPIEIIMGAHFNVANGFRINMGAGTFLNQAFGGAVARGLFGLEWFPDVEKPDRDKDGVYDDEDACPDVAGVRTGDPKTNGCPPPPPDRDGDGIIDSEDACPDVPGPRTNDPKTNGCPPPPDRDGDGVPDAVDACPDVPGVKTDDPKTNGCPPDRDGDGVLDKDDACPDVPGIKTNDPKTNGCPDTDRDKDGILNDVDACPDQAGPKSDDPKTTGCPRVFIKNGLIQILEQPKFDFNKSNIKPESDSLLTEVAKAMTDHPEIKRVRVEGHTDNVGSAPYNLKLSQQRADSVIKWLSSHGIAADRLTAKGMGLTTPLVPNDTELNRALNRRVEFHIEDQEQTVKEMVKTPGGGTVVAPPKDAVQPKKPAPNPTPAPAPKPAPKP
jgi:OOP family OmpA-OmpF porin